MRLANLMVVCLLVLPLSGQEANDPEDMLLRIRKKCLATLEKLPRYMCTQTINRDYLEPAVRVEYHSCDDLLGAHHLAQPELVRTRSDRLRLNVAATSKEELYSWVGEAKFSDRGLFDLVETGPLQTGNFEAFLAMIFSNDEATFSYIGENVVNGRRQLEFGFRTPRERSHYYFGPRDRSQSGAISYSGTFTADIATLDLIQVIIRAGELPDKMAVCSSSTTYDYKRVRLQNAEFLLPAQTRLHMVMANGDENSSQTTFTACHEFLGESTLKFDIPEVGGGGKANATSESRRVVLPPGIPFKVALTNGVDTGVAAAGDAVHGKLTLPIRSKRPKFEIPVGTPVQGRIIRLEHAHGKAESVTMVIRLETLEVNGETVPFTARSVNGLNIQPVKHGFSSRGLDLGKMSDLSPRGVAVFHFRNAGEKYLVTSGLESPWVTLGARR